MIDWLTQSSAAHPAIAQGNAPEALLSAAERARLSAMPVAKRRSDWLLGRWTAKHLVQAHIAQHTDVRLPLSDITIASDADGAPRIVLEPGSNTASLLHLDLALSISHSNGQAFCALHNTTAGALGVDIERVERRAPEFAHDFFTPPELAQLHTAPPSQRDTLTTLIWSAKEAALKALHLGLTVDTHSVACLPGARYGPAWGWSALDVRSTLPQAQAGMAGWWRTIGEYVLTIVVLAG